MDKTVMPAPATQSQSTAPDALADAGTRPFLSLKWKAILLSSALLLSVAFAYTLLSYRNLTTQINQGWEEGHQRDLRELRTIVGNAVLRLERLGGLVPTLAGMRAALLDADADRLRTAFEASWPRLQLEMDIGAVAIYDTRDQLLGEWRFGSSGQMPESMIAQWVSIANSRDQPVYALACRYECLLYATVPLLIEGREVGVVVLASSLADVVLQFKEITNSDIAVLAPTVGTAPGRNELPEWGYRAVAISGYPISFQLLEQLSRSTPLDGFRATTLETPDATFELRWFDRDSLLSTGLPFQLDPGLRIVGIRDVSQAIAGVHSATRQSLAVGLVGLVLSELLLVVLLRSPMRRLRRTAGQLPLLAARKFNRVRTTIGAGMRARLTRDEFDVLDDTAIQLSYQLETLEGQVRERSEQLSKHMQELRSERDFVNSLLDTAQVMILTLDRGSRVIAVNRYALEQSGFGLDEVRGRRFASLLSPIGLLPDLPGRLAELATGRGRNLRHESMLRCRDGSTRSVTWYHSRLNPGADNTAAVLSVGLDITDRREAERRLSWLDRHDALTGLANRHGLQDELESLLEHAGSAAPRGALLVFDLDQFKFINDRDGHDAGDTVLKVVADTLRKGMSEILCLARLGGDEFGLLSEARDQEAASQLARELNSRLAAIEWPQGSPAQNLSACTGIAMIDDHTDAADDLLTRSELAMKLAKERGRGQWHLYSDSDQAMERVKRRVYGKAEVQQALDSGTLMLHFQPIREVLGTRVSHYEALLRIRQEDGSLRPPAGFIDAAERSGMIHLVDRRILSLALDQLADVPRKEIIFSVNLSGPGLCDPEFTNHLVAELERTGVDASRVVFEITETAAVADFPAARELMGTMRALGCRFALDDFGVGFSSFYYLKQLPIDFVKIDGSFITRLSVNADDQILVRALSQVARGFGKETIAEYVEDDETLALLAEFGIDYAQGYYLGRPLPAPEAFVES